MDELSHPRATTVQHDLDVFLRTLVHTISTSGAAESQEVSGPKRCLALWLCGDMLTGFKLIVFLQTCRANDLRWNKLFLMEIVHSLHLLPDMFNFPFKSPDLWINTCLLLCTSRNRPAFILQTQYVMQANLQMDKWLRTVVLKKL